MSIVLIRWNHKVYDYRRALNDPVHCHRLYQSIGEKTQYVPKKGDKIVILMTDGLGIVAIGKVVEGVKIGIKHQQDQYNIGSQRHHSIENKYITISIRKCLIDIEDIEQYDKIKYMRRTVQKLNPKIFDDFIDSMSYWIN